MMVLNGLFEDFVKIVVVAAAAATITTASAFYHIISNQKSIFKYCY